MDALFLCALPYHATNEFVRVVQTLSIGKGLWSWLSKMQDTGASMPRELLIKRCINDKVRAAFQPAAVTHPTGPSPTAPGGASSCRTALT